MGLTSMIRQLHNIMRRPITWVKKIFNKFRRDKRRAASVEDLQLKKLVYFFFTGYLLIYLFFLFDTTFPAGPGLEAKDWLSFFGDYLSFAATLLVCLVSLYQNKVFREKTERQQEEKRFKEVQPTFSVDVVTTNKSRMGSKEDIEKDSNLILKDFRFKVKNLGVFPVLHVRIFDFYWLPALGPGEATELTVDYSIKTNVHIPSSDISISLPVGESGENPPAHVNIEYYDVDGNSMFQEFQLSEYRNRSLYILTKKDRW